jgi:hypothetical protein
LLLSLLPKEPYILRQLYLIKNWVLFEKLFLLSWFLPIWLFPFMITLFQIILEWQGEKDNTHLMIE